MQDEMFDSLESEVARLRRELDELKAERDALATHVELMSKAALDAIHYLPGGDIKAELRDAYDETPETSLARLKAEWQADGAESFKAEMLKSTKTFIHPHIEGVHAVWLRRQAEGGDI